MKTKLAGKEHPAYSVPIALRSLAEQYRGCRGKDDEAKR